MQVIRSIIRDGMKASYSDVRSLKISSMLRSVAFLDIQ
ncbi:hypothetical protein NSP_17090 [Nodularia spumigena CCY9414]|nr:hypothetical protein NSP_17090 [Nodularia spumigena CCY9414]